MFTTLSILGILILVISSIIVKKDGDLAEILAPIAAFFLIVGIIGCAVTGVAVVSGSTLPERIEFQETYIADLEAMTDNVTKNYVAYESDVIKSIEAGDDASVYAAGTAYPSVGGIELFEEQLDLLQDARRDLLKLQQKQARQNAWKWWLYFNIH